MLAPPIRKRSRSVKRRKSVKRQPDKDRTPMNDSTRCIVNPPPESYVIGDSVRFVGKQPWYSSLKSVRFGANVADIGERCFSGCELLSEVSFMPAKCKRRIGPGAFEGCVSLTRFVWPGTAEKIPESCFAKCRSLDDFTFEDISGVREIGAEAFRECGSLSGFAWPSAVGDVPLRCFMRCSSLEQFQFEPGSCASRIRRAAFQGCRSLKHIVLPRTVNAIESNSFSSCPSLEELGVEGGSSLQRDSFRGSGISDTFRLILCEPRSPDLRDWSVDVRDLENTREVIGSGGSSQVKLFKRKDGRKIAGKFFTDQETSNVEKYWKLELDISVKLWHPCIIKFEGYSRPSEDTGNQYVLFTRYASGGTLAGVIASPDSFPWFDSTRRTIIVCGIALAMEYVHSRGVIHSDLKPENVLLDENHYPYVCDLGSGVPEDFIVTRLHRTWIYAAPELSSDDDPKYDKKNDVFSFGVMLYEIVTGKRIRMIPQQAVMSFLNKKRPKIPECVSECAKSLIMKCWAHEMDERPTFSGILARLKDNQYRLFPDVDSDAVKRYVDMIEHRLMI